jgi:hypothetical protein
MAKFNTTDLAKCLKVFPYLVMLLVLIDRSSYANDFHVKDTIEFKKAVYQAKSGDTILLSSGVYHDAKVSISNNSIVITGTEPDAPPVFTGKSGFYIGGDNVVVKNIFFDRITTGSIIQFGKGIGASIENSTFFECGKNEIRSSHLVRIHPDAKNVSVTGNRFLGSKSMSVGVIINQDKIGGHHVISSNIFNNTLRTVDNGLEPVQVGQNKKYQHVESHVTIEKNIFDNVIGDPESLSLKTSRNNVSGNLFYNSSSLTLRGGESNTVKRNCFIDNKIGIRVFDNGHVLSKNLFIGNETAIYLHRLNNQSPASSTHKPAHHILIDGNSFYMFASVEERKRLVNNIPAADSISFELSNNYLYLSRKVFERIELKKISIDGFRDLEIFSSPEWKVGSTPFMSSDMTLDGASPKHIRSVEQCADFLNKIAS